MDGCFHSGKKGEKNGAIPRRRLLSVQALLLFSASASIAGTPMERAELLASWDFQIKRCHCFRQSNKQPSSRRARCRSFLVAGAMRLVCASGECAPPLFPYADTYSISQAEHHRTNCGKRPANAMLCFCALISHEDRDPCLHQCRWYVRWVMVLRAGRSTPYADPEPRLLEWASHRNACMANRVWVETSTRVPCIYLAIRCRPSDGGLPFPVAPKSHFFFSGTIWRGPEDESQGMGR